MPNKKPKSDDFFSDPNRTALDMDKSHESYTGHTSENVAQRDVVVHHRERPSMPGSSTGDAEIATYIGVPGQDYEATWGISVSFRTLKK